MPLSLAELVEDMATSGLITFGAHTDNHADLTQLSPGAADKQVRDSKRALEARLGMAVNLLAYPSGQYNIAVMRLAEGAGFLAAVTTRYGNRHVRDDIYQLKRTRVNGRGNLSAFIGGLQYADSEVAQAPPPAAPPTPTSTPTPQPTATPTPSPTKRSTPITAQTAVPLSVPEGIVPNVVGLLEAEARLSINHAGLDTGYPNYQTAEDIKPENRDLLLSVPVGRVVCQQPPPGTALKRGEKVNLAIRRK
ncbi:MAG: polysaccharide deacetylase family protein [Chloroflexi bacterium]|nr:polysaccharide deacetylase family protein [Chloroflexota bacterium]